MTHGSAEKHGSSTRVSWGNVIGNKQFNLLSSPNVFTTPSALFVLYNSWKKGGKDGVILCRLCRFSSIFG